MRQSRSVTAYSAGLPAGQVAAHLVFVRGRVHPGRRTRVSSRVARLPPREIRRRGTQGAGTDVEEFDENDERRSHHVYSVQKDDWIGRR